LLFLTGCSTKEYFYSSSSSSSHKPTYKQKKPSTAAMHKATMKPYKVGGKTYYPTVVKVGDTFRGIASWYGSKFHGKKTSSGEYFNMYDLTAAHKTLPMNTILRVTNLNNGRSEIVRVNDRGPFVDNRIIDLSYMAAKRLGMIKNGTAPVKLEVISFDAKIPHIKDRKESVEIGNFAIQVGSFSRIEGAKKIQRRYKSHYYKTYIKSGYSNGFRVYRVFIGGFKSRLEARDYIDEHNLRGAFIVRE
jgi:rare lipoprotein A